MTPQGPPSFRTKTFFLTRLGFYSSDYHDLMIKTGDHDDGSALHYLQTVDCADDSAIKRTRETMWTFDDCHVITAVPDPLISQPPKAGSVFLKKANRSETSLNFLPDKIA